MYKLAVVGKNINYSKSPFIHSAFAQALGLAIEYTIQDVGEGSFADKIAELRAAGFNGCNITVPYKEDAFRLADKASARAEQAGAANTFVFRTDGTVFADNTDGVGFIRDVTHNIGFTLTGKKILIAGAGGAVRGALGPLIAQNPTGITIANRTVAKAHELAQLFTTRSVPVNGCDYAALATQSFDVIIDGSSLKTELVPIPTGMTLSPHALVYDLKYSPGIPTPIMRWAHDHQVQKTHDGMGMLVEQAAEAFQLWTGKMPNTAPVLKSLL